MSRMRHTCRAGRRVGDGREPRAGRSGSSRTDCSESPCDDRRTPGARTPRSGRFDAELASAEGGHVILGEEKQKLVELQALLRVERAEQLVVELPAQRA